MLIGSLFMYLVLIAGLCVAAYRTMEDGGGCVSGLILLVLCVLELFEIGRAIVNPDYRSTTIAMIVIDTAAIIFVSILLIRNRE